MNERAEIRFKSPRFRTSILAVLSAVFLVGSAQALVSAAEEPLRPAVLYLIKLVVVHGHWDVIPVSGRRPMWTFAVLNLGIAAVTLGLGLTVAYWNSRKRAT